MKSRRNNEASSFNRLVSFVLMLAISDVTVLVPLATVANAQLAASETQRQVSRVNSNAAISGLYQKNLDKVSKTCDKRAGQAIPGLVIQKLLDKKIEAAVKAEEAKRGKAFDWASEEFVRFKDDVGMKLLPEVKKAVKKMGDDVPADIADEVYANANDQLMQCYFDEARSCGKKFDDLGEGLATAVAKKSKYKGLVLTQDFVDGSGQNYQFNFLNGVNDFLKQKGVDTPKKLSKYRELKAFLEAGSCYDAARRKFRAVGMGKGPKKENKCMDPQANPTDFHAADVAAGGKKIYPFRQPNPNGGYLDKQISCDLICDMAPSAKYPSEKELRCEKPGFWAALEKTGPVQPWELPSNYMRCDFSPQEQCEGGAYDPREFEKKMGQVSAQDELHQMRIALAKSESAEDKRQANKFNNGVNKKVRVLTDTILGTSDDVNIAPIVNMPLGSMDLEEVEKIHYMSVKDDLTDKLVDFHDTLFIESYLQSASVTYNGVDSYGYRSALDELDSELASCKETDRTKIVRAKLAELNKKLNSAFTKSKVLKQMSTVAGLAVTAQGSPDQTVEQMANAFVCATQLKKRFRRLEHELGTDFVDSLRPVIKDEEIVGAFGEHGAAVIEIATNINPITAVTRLLLTRLPIAGDLDGASDQYCHPGKQFFLRGKGVGKAALYEQQDTDGTTVQLSGGELGSLAYCQSVAQEYSFLGEQLHDLFAQHPEMLADLNFQTRHEAALKLMKEKGTTYKESFAWAKMTVKPKTIFDLIDEKELKVADESVWNYNADLVRHKPKSMCLWQGQPTSEEDPYTSLECEKKGLCWIDAAQGGALMFDRVASQKECASAGGSFDKFEAGPIVVDEDDDFYNQDRTPRTCMDKMAGKKPRPELVSALKEVLNEGRGENLAKAREGIKESVCASTPAKVAADVTKNSQLMKHFFDCKRPRFFKAAQNFGLYIPNSPIFQDELSAQECATRNNAAWAACHMRSDAQYDATMTAGAEQSNAEFLMGAFDALSLAGAAASGTQLKIRPSVSGVLIGGAIGGGLAWAAVPSASDIAEMKSKARKSVGDFALGFGNFAEAVNSKKQLKELSENDPRTMGILKGFMYGAMFGSIQALGPKAPKGLSIPKATAIKGAMGVGLKGADVVVAGEKLKTVAQHVDDYRAWKSNLDNTVSNAADRVKANEQLIGVLNDGIKATHKIDVSDIPLDKLSVEQRIRLLTDSSLDDLSPAKRLAKVMYSDGRVSPLVAKGKPTKPADAAKIAMEIAEKRNPRPKNNADEVVEDLKNTSPVTKMDQVDGFKENQTILVRDAEAANSAGDGSRAVALAEQDGWAPATIVREGKDTYAVYDRRTPDGSLKSHRRKLTADELESGNVRQADFNKIKSRLTSRYGKNTVKGLSEQDLIYLQWIDDWTSHYKGKAKTLAARANDLKKGAKRLAKSDPKKAKELEAEAKKLLDEANDMRKLAQETDVKVKKALEENKKRDPSEPCPV